jgi:hypothetical protein
MSFLRLARLAAIIGLLSLCGGLSACSAIKLGYTNLPEFAYWWLDGYLDFDDAQSQRAREDLARLHAWHRAQELPRFQQLLQKAEKLAAADITPAQACSFEPDLRERLAATRERAEPMLVAHAVLLDASQLQHLERKFAQKNREFESDWLKPPAAEVRDKRAKQMVERAETVYGTLDDAQRALLRRQLDQSPFDPATVLADRRRRQRDVLDTLRRVSTQQVPLQEARAAVRAVGDRMLESPNPAYRAYVDAIRQENCRIIAAVHNATNATQRDFAARRLRAWQRDLAELSSGR